MERDRRASLAVGAFALAALVAFAAAVLSLSAQQGLLTPRYRLVAHFHNVQGLIEGAPVRLAGTDVGRVEEVSFVQLGREGPPVRVGLSIDERVKERIRSDSRATIGTIGLLGDKYVEVSPGTPGGHVLEDGERIAAVTPLDLADVMAKGTKALDDLASLASNVNQVVAEFREKMGGAKVAEAAQAFSDIAREVKQGKGLLHSLIYDPYQGEGVESISRSLEILEDILNEVATGQGLLHVLIYEPASEQDVVNQALEAAARLNSILARIDRGEGTLGLLLTDPTVYEDLKLLLDGARRSRVVRTLISLTGGAAED